MDFSIFINWILPFSIWVQLGDIYLFLRKKKWHSSLKAISKDPDQMPHSTVSDLGLYWLSHQDVSGKYYHFFIAKVTVSRELFHAFLSSADVFILLYFIFLFFFLKNTFFFKKKSE